MSNKKNRKKPPAARRMGGDLRRRGLPTYSEERATRHLLAFAGKHHWHEMERAVTGKQSEEDRRALMLLVLLLGAVQPPPQAVVAFPSDLLDCLAPLSASELARSRTRLAEAYGVTVERDGQVEAWQLPRRVRTLLMVFPMGTLRSAWTAMAADRQACLAMLALAGKNLDGDATVALAYSDLTAAAGRPVSGILDLEHFLIETGALVWAMPAGDGDTRWRLSSAVLR